MFTPLEQKRYSDTIVELIQEKILSDHLKIGTRLPSDIDLSLEFKVSRSVIREALRILEISRLVKIKKGPTGGIFVSHVYHRPIKNSLNNLITSGDVTIDYLFDVRILIEPHITKEAALNAKGNDVQCLSELIQNSSEHLDDPVHLEKNNLQLHLL